MWCAGKTTAKLSAAVRVASKVGFCSETSRTARCLFARTRAAVETAGSVFAAGTSFERFEALVARGLGSDSIVAKEMQAVPTPMLACVIVTKHL